MSLTAARQPGPVRLKASRSHTAAGFSHCRIFPKRQERSVTIAVLFLRLSS
jgi:hypothetical protein